MEENGLGDEDLLTLIQTDKGPTFQTNALVKAKKYKVKDELSSWEEFGKVQNAQYHEAVGLASREARHGQTFLASLKGPRLEA